MVCKVAQAACMAADYKVVTRERFKKYLSPIFYEKEKLFKIELKESYIYIYYNLLQICSYLEGKEQCMMVILTSSNAYQSRPADSTG
jgi:hypothetical protein